MIEVKQFMINNLKKFITIIVALSIQSCVFDTKFDKQRWEDRTDNIFPPEHRAAMLKDLTENHKLKGKTISELENLLGRSDGIENNHMYYEIIIEYSGVDPDYKKDLVFNFSKDSVITSFEIKEWKE